jgi:hypothetical protein
LGPKPDDGLAVIDLLLERARLGFELFVLSLLLPDLALKLQFGLLDRLDPVCSVLFELFNLLLEPLLVFLISFDVLALDNLLRLLCHAVELHILCPFGKVQDLELQSLLLRLDCLELLVRCHDLAHQVDLLLTDCQNLLVLIMNHTVFDQNSVFIIGRHRLLGNFDLTLAHVYDDFVVELELLFVFNPLEFFLV